MSTPRPRTTDHPWRCPVCGAKLHPRDPRCDEIRCNLCETTSDAATSRLAGRAYQAIERAGWEPTLWQGELGVVDGSERIVTVWLDERTWRMGCYDPWVAYELSQIDELTHESIRHP